MAKSIKTDRPSLKNLYKTPKPSKVKARKLRLKLPKFSGKFTSKRIK